jgi:hypothetical protein
MNGGVLCLIEVEEEVVLTVTACTRRKRIASRTQTQALPCSGIQTETGA